MKRVEDVLSVCKGILVVGKSSAEAASRKGTKLVKENETLKPAQDLFEEVIVVSVKDNLRDLVAYVSFILLILKFSYIASI